MVLWTPESVREQLPPVTCRLQSGEIVKAKVCGRKNAFASVSVENAASSFEVAWVTVARCLNTNRPIRL